MIRFIRIVFKLIVYGVVTPFAALCASFLSLAFVAATDYSEIDTVGIIKYCGFPIWFRVWHPDILGPQGFYMSRFAFNNAFWLGIFEGIAYLCMRLLAWVFQHGVDAGEDFKEKTLVRNLHRRD
ncbi:MAG: hypothetical protein K1Y02_11725 [Candidatus Hydrogenedentes bacterium]|nr:hypothetical protein [Candidatus Hydrogenedentota bacterium]